MSTRKLVTISLSPRLLAEALHAAERERRTKSEFFREAVRFYLENGAAQRKAVREQFFSFVDRAQERTKGASRLRVRRLIREAVQAARKSA